MMGFKDDYTTDELIAMHVLDDDLKAEGKREKDKVVLSNDAYAIGQLLECLINRMVK